MLKGFDIRKKLLAKTTTTTTLFCILRFRYPTKIKGLRSIIEKMNR